MVYSDGWISFLSLGLDFITFIVLAIWYLSVRSGAIPVSTRVITTGVCLFVIIDAVYYYLYFYGLYMPNSLIDAGYMASLVLVAGGVYLSVPALDQVGAHSPAGEYGNEGFRHNGLIIMVCPLTIALAHPILLTDWLAFGLMALIHESASTQVQTGIITQNLLIREKEMTGVLEGRIEERTQQLVTMNQQLQENIQELDYISNQDTVTNLYNRRFFRNALEERLRLVQIPDTLALLFLDLDRFKTINDTYGHDLGDRVLVEIASRLTQMQEKDSFLARLGGDEFVFAFHGSYDYPEIETIAKRIIDFCGRPIAIDQYLFHITLSLGISIYPLDASDSSTLMKHADIAMYHAKKMGSNNFVSFNTIFSDEIHRKNDVEMLLREAVIDQSFQLYFQPQFSLPDRKLTGMEALIRWRLPNGSFISPAEFIPIAEEINMIVPPGQLGDAAGGAADCLLEQYVRFEPEDGDQYFTQAAG